MLSTNLCPVVKLFWPKNPYKFTPKNAKEEDIVTEEDIPKFIEKKIKSA